MITSEGGYYAWDRDMTRLSNERPGFYRWLEHNKWFGLSPVENYKARVALANWWDKAHKESDKEVDRILQKNVDAALRLQQSESFIDRFEGARIMWSVGSIYAVYTLSTELGKGYVDVLRLGQGTFVERSVGGVMRDMLRILAILPTAAVRAGVAGLVRPLSGRLATAGMVAQKFVGVQSSNQCTINTGARALAMVGGKRYLNLIQFLFEGGVMPRSGVWSQGAGMWISEVAPAIRANGVRVTEQTVMTMVEVETLAKQNPNGVVMFSAHSTVSAGGHANHTMLATAMEGGVKYFDTTGQVFKDYSAFAQVYKNAAPYHAAIVHEAVPLMERPLAHAVANVLHLIAVRAWELPLLPLVLSDASVMIAASEKKKSKPAPQPAQQPPARPERPGHEISTFKVCTPVRMNSDGLTQEWCRTFQTYTVRPNDSLQAISYKFYGTFSNWQIIYDANRGTIGPGMTIHPGQTLRIPMP